MTKPNLSKDEDLHRFRTRRQVYVLQQKANLAILLREAEPAGVVTEVAREASEMLQLAEAHEFAAWLQEIRDWELTPAQHRARAAELRTRAARLAWDPRRELEEVAGDHELAAHVLEHPGEGVSALSEWIGRNR
jgi:hypothetical protein